MEGRMKHVSIEGANYRVCLETDGASLSVSDGYFGEIKILRSPLFLMQVKHISDGSKAVITSEASWQEIEVVSGSDNYRFTFKDPGGIEGLTVTFWGSADEEGIRWTGAVTNHNADFSVMEITYPRLDVTAPHYDLFVPMMSGIVIPDAGVKGYRYQGRQLHMQFFAAYGGCGGLYYGIHDPAPAQKRYAISSQDTRLRLDVHYTGENGTLPQNSFSLSGSCVWQSLGTGADWYDAAKLYAAFVRREAEWIPEVDENGRVDLSPRFQDIPFWVCDYIPNSPSQGDNKPMSLSAKSDIYAEDYWYRAVIDLKDALGVPIAYHVYNWHEIPFNVDYPHFMPARDKFKEGLKKLRKNDVPVTPYINSLSWETRDDHSGKFDVTFENTGKYGAAKAEDGSPYAVSYPQTHGDGIKVDLSPMCPTYKKWQTLMRDLVREMEDTLDIDGVYFDQISATPGSPCYDKSHGHPLGGGRYWCDGYRAMLRPILDAKPQGAYYFSEDNTEGYMNLFDGFLTWRWIMSEAVPAFPAVYSGYIQTIGRSTMGAKKEDTEFFKYSLAQSFLYGQLLGWCKADVLYDKERLDFLKTLVTARHQYSYLFRWAEMLRSPRVRCSLEAKTTTPGLYFKTDVVMEQVLAAAWQHRSDKKTVIFIINISKETAQYSLEFSNTEYGIDEDQLTARGFSVSDDGQACISDTISPESIICLAF